MNFQFYLEKLYDSKEFQEYKKENPNSKLAGGFFAIDKENKGQGDKAHIDFYEPELKKMVSFQLNNEIALIPVEQTPDIINSIADNLEFDFNEIEKIILDKMQQENIQKEIQKILLSLQNIDNKDYLVGTVFTSGMGMIKINIELSEKEITDFQNKSFLDIINVFKKDKK